jgi:hypothetical protein
MKQASWERALVVKPQGLNKKSWLGLGLVMVGGGGGVHYLGVSPVGAVSGSGLASWVAKPLRGSPDPLEAWMI